jgi:hypothetical protein
VELQMNVFISYSREEAAVACLLAYILDLHGIHCEFDRHIPPGDDFHVDIRDMIRRADIVIALMTNAAVASPWVNQEVGFSLALQKSILPVLIERDIQHIGMLSRIQPVPLFDWSEPSRSIKPLIDALSRSAQEAVSPLEVVGLDRVIYGKIERTKFLVGRLEDLAGDTAGLVVLNQAAFTIFAASSDPGYGTAGGHGPTEMQLLLQEKEAFGKLVDAPNVTLKFLLCPEQRSYRKDYLEMRFRNLLGWMRRTKDHPRVSYACADIPVPNRLIVVGKLFIEGSKHQHGPNYDVTFVKERPEDVDRAVKEFNDIFERSYRGNALTIDKIDQLYARLKHDGS